MSVQRLDRLREAFFAEENSERRERLLDLIVTCVKLALRRGERNRYEVHVGHWGHVEGDGYKLIDTVRLYTLPSREAAWRRLIELATEYDLATLLIRKPQHLLYSDLYPTPWDTPPEAMAEMVRHALRQSFMLPPLSRVDSGSPYLTALEAAR